MLLQRIRERSQRSARRKPVMDLGRYYDDQRYRVPMFRARWQIYALISPWCITKGDVRDLLHLDLAARRRVALTGGVDGAAALPSRGRWFNWVRVCGRGFLWAGFCGSPLAASAFYFYNIPMCILQRSIRLSGWLAKKMWKVWRDRCLAKASLERGVL